MQLPFSWPVSETYQSGSLVMGVLLSHDNISKLYESSFLAIFKEKMGSELGRFQTIGHFRDEFISSESVFRNNIQ